jgi:hypothetical protein
MPGLKAIHEQKRANFAAQMLEEAKTDHQPIVFTDESMFMQNLSRPGVWRRRGVFSPQYAFPKDAHSPISVMVWGAISSGGYMSRILRCPDHVDAKSYKKMLSDARITDELNRVFGVGRYRFQQDNALPRTAARIGRRSSPRNFLATSFPRE